MQSRLRLRVLRAGLAESDATRKAEREPQILAVDVRVSLSSDLPVGVLAVPGGSQAGYPTRCATEECAAARDTRSALHLAGRRGTTSGQDGDASINLTPTLEEDRISAYPQSN